MKHLYLEMMLLRERSNFSEASIRSFLSDEFISSFTENLKRVYSSEAVTEKDVFTPKGFDICPLGCETPL